MRWKLFQILNNLLSITFSRSVIRTIVKELKYDGSLDSDNLITIARLNIESAARSGKKTAVAFEFYGADISFKDITPDNLSGAAKDVYNFCYDNVFQPEFKFEHDKEQNHCFKIIVTLPTIA